MARFESVAAIVTGRPLVNACILLVTAFGLQFFYRLYLHRRWFRGLPKPPHDFLWGHLKVMGEIASTFPPNTHPQAYYTAIARKYNLKGIFYIDLWPIAPSSVVLSDPELLDQVTVVHPLRISKFADDFLAPMIGHNVIAAVNGPIWKKLHNSMAPAFSWSHIKNLTGVMVEETMHFRNALDGLAKTGEVFSMEETSMKLIFDVITRIVFSFSLNAQTEGSSYLDDLREMIHLAENQLSFNPFVHLMTFFKRRKVLGRLHPSILTKIRERFALLRSENVVPSRKDPASILDLMLREDLGAGKSGDGNDGLSPEYLDLLLTNIKGLLVGGHGTTTDSLCYIYMLLSNAPAVVEKLREEHTKVFHSDFNETINILLESPEKLNELEYTGAVIKETLRLFPVGFGVREGEPGTTIEFNRQIYPIDNQLIVALNGHDLHYDAKYFSDPCQFRPERWTGVNNQVPRSYFRAFGRGARACLGQNLSQNELKVVLLMTMRDYTFECANLKPNVKPKTPYTDMDTVYGDIIFQELGLEAKPRGGMMMRVRKPA